MFTRAFVFHRLRDDPFALMAQTRAGARIMGWGRCVSAQECNAAVLVWMHKASDQQSSHTAL